MQGQTEGEVIIGLKMGIRSTMKRRAHEHTYYCKSNNKNEATRNKPALENDRTKSLAKEYSFVRYFFWDAPKPYPQAQQGVREVMWLRLMAKGP